MQTNALSRQVALLAEPMSTSSGFFVHTMKHCYATALYTTEAQALSITHARISLLHACNHERKYGNAIAIFETKPLYEKRQPWTDTHSRAQRRSTHWNIWNTRMR